MTASADSRISDERLDGLTTLLQGAMSRIDADDMVEVPADYLRGAVLVFAELHQARALIGKVRDVLEAIQYGSRNCIKEHGQKTVNELATVGLIYLDDATPITELRERRAQAAAVKPLEWREIDRAAWLGLRIESGPYVIQQYKNGDGSLRTDLFDVFKNDTGRAVYRATGLGEAKLWASFDAALAAPPPAQAAGVTEARNEIEHFLSHTYDGPINDIHKHHLRKWLAALSAQDREEGTPHPDDLAVDRFATAMKAKLAKKRAEGRGGWERKDECTAEFLSQLLREHVAKGDPVDVGNLAMMLHQRGERIVE